jgi:16S rRNA (uracil1498-N3)-methyltransferase
LVPLLTERGNDRESPAGLKRLERAVIEASKQCGRNRLMVINPPLGLEEFLAARPQSAIGLCAHPGGAPLAVELQGVPPDVREIHLAVGPEGGFTALEVDAATSAGWRVVDLGRRILRVETAAIALVSCVVVNFGEA